MKRLAWLGFALSLALPAPPARAAGDSALSSLVAAERAFSAMSVRKGVRESFLAYLAPDAVVFKPTATNARKAMKSEPATSVATLIWEPSYAEVSAAGDLGYTTGPWELRPPALKPGPTFYGHFISVWKKQAGGAWRVVIDIGTSHERPARGVGSGDFTPGPAPSVAAAGDTSRPDLRALDRGLAKAMKTAGMGGAFATWATGDVRFNRDDVPALVGIKEVRARLDSIPGWIEYLPEGRRLAASGDLGCTYGRAAHLTGPGAAAADSNVYVHVWRKGADRRWKLALEVLNPLRR